MAKNKPGPDPLPAGLAKSEQLLVRLRPDQYRQLYNKTSKLKGSNTPQDVVRALIDEWINVEEGESIKLKGFTASN